VIRGGVEGGGGVCEVTRLARDGRAEAAREEPPHAVLFQHSLRLCTLTTGAL
jgi:hypothetical protein